MTKMNPHVKTKASVRKLKTSLFANAAKVGRVKLVKKKVNDKKIYILKVENITRNMESLS